jgi:hypothetical protein
MKKMIIVLLSLVMVFAFVGTAYALTTGNNETNSWNPPGPTYTYPGATAGLRGGTAWVDTDGSPHSNYGTTSNKCEVCHSPHQAGTSGSSYKLLYGTTSGSGAAAACLVCHVFSSLSIADVYEATPTAGGHDLIAVDHVPDSTWALTGATLGCSDCHTVHGAGAIGTGAFILRSKPTWAGVAWSGTAVNETEFCGGCHDQNYPGAINGISHFMGDAVDSTSTGGATVLSTASSTDCASCHRAPRSTGTTNGTSVKWPHQSVSIVGLGLGSSGTAVTDQNHMDDHCLVCHGRIGLDY